MTPPTLGNAVQRILGRIDVQFRRDGSYDELAETWQDAAPLPDRAAVEAAFQTLMDEYNAQLAQRQQEAAARESDIQQVRAAQVEAALTQIDNHLQAVANNATDVSSASTMAAFRQIVAAMLAREQAALQRERRIIRVLWRLVE